jgi:hypothetical protein
MGTNVVAGPSGTQNPPVGTAPDLQLNFNSQTPSGNTFAPSTGLSKVISYTVLVVGGNVAAQGVLVDVNNLFSDFTQDVAPSSAAMWERITPTPVAGIHTYRLRSGFAVGCGATATLNITYTRTTATGFTTGSATSPGTAPLTATVRMPEGGPQDLQTLNNTRSAQYSVRND